MIDRSYYICMRLKKTGQENKVSNISNRIKREKQHESIKGDSTGGGNETVSDRKWISEKKWDRERTRDKQPQRAATVEGVWLYYDSSKMSKALCMHSHLALTDRKTKRQSNLHSDTGRWTRGSCQRIIRPYGQRSSGAHFSFIHTHLLNWFGML